MVICAVGGDKEGAECLTYTHAQKERMARKYIIPE